MIARWYPLMAGPKLDGPAVRSNGFVTLVVHKFTPEPPSSDVSTLLVQPTDAFVVNQIPGSHDAVVHFHGQLPTGTAVLCVVYYDNEKLLRYACLIED